MFDGFDGLDGAPRASATSPPTCSISASDSVSFCTLILLVGLRGAAAAAPVPHDRGREPRGRGRQARRLAVPALSRPDQPLRDPDRARRPCGVPQRRDRPGHDGAGAAAPRRRGLHCARRLPRRPLGRDRHGDRRVRRGRDHDLEPPRHADRAAAARLRGRGAAASDRSDLSGFVLGVRRVAIVVVLLLGYAYYRVAGDAALAAIGLLSFAAIAQIAPAFVGGLFWSRGTALGASAGLVVGFGSGPTRCSCRASSGEGVLWSDLLIDGPFGIAALKPTALFGTSMPQLTHGVVWSLGAQRPRLCGAFALAACERARAAAGQRLRGRARPLDRADLPPVPRQRHGRRAAGDGRALSRRGAHEPLLPGLRAQPRPAPRRPRARPTSTCCAMPSTCSPRRSAPPPRALRCRSCCAGATSRRRQR